MGPQGSGPPSLGLCPQNCPSWWQDGCHRSRQLTLIHQPLEAAGPVVFLTQPGRCSREPSGQGSPGCGLDDCGVVPPAILGAAGTARHSAGSRGRAPDRGRLLRPPPPAPAREAGPGGLSHRQPKVSGQQVSLPCRQPGHPAVRPGLPLPHWKPVPMPLAGDSSVWSPGSPVPSGHTSALLGSVPLLTGEGAGPRGRVWGPPVALFPPRLPAVPSHTG